MKTDFESDDFLEILTPDAEPDQITTLLPNTDGSMEVVFEDAPVENDPKIANTNSLDHSANLADFLDAEALAHIEAICQQRYNDDRMSMDEQFQIINRGLEHLGLTLEELDDPFPGASPVTHPLILEAALKTQAKIMGEVFSGKGIVDTYQMSDEPDAVDQANRVKNFMDYQYLQQMDEFIPETERMAFRFGLTGNAYRKYFYDPIEDRPTTRYVTEDKFIINSGMSTLKKADFYTELYPLDRHDLEQLIEMGEFKQFDFGGENTSSDNVIGNLTPSDVDQQIIFETGEQMGFQSSFNAGPDRFSIREHHCYLKLPAPYNDGVTRALPYIVTIEDSTNCILSIRRNWKESDPKKLKRVWYSHYKLIPGLGFHGLGYIHILGNFQFALTAIMRSLIDSGQFSNMQGGFRAKGIRFSKDANIPLGFGEYREIDTQGKPIQDVLLSLQYKEPSQVLERMTAWLDGRASQFADSTESVIADSTNYGPVGTTVALLEASTKFISGILKRFYNSLASEFKILHDLNYDVLEETQDYYLKGTKFNVTREDFSGQVDVIPAADPNLSSSAHRIALAQTKLQAAQQSPQIHDLRAAYTEFYGQIGMEKDEIDRLMPPPESAQPLDPLGDIQAAANGKPIKAFPGQDHMAHIEMKQTFLQDPMGGANQMASAIVPILQANIQEHLLLQYVERMQGAAQSMGIDPETLSQAGMEMAQAEAAKRVAVINSEDNLDALIASNDPAVILAQAEQLNAQTKAEDVKNKLILGMGKIQNDAQKLELQRLEIAQEGVQHATSIKADLTKNDKQLGAKMVMEALKPKPPKQQAPNGSKPPAKKP